TGRRALPRRRARTDGGLEECRRGRASRGVCGVPPAELERGDARGEDCRPYPSCVCRRPRPVRSYGPCLGADGPGGTRRAAAGSSTLHSPSGTTLPQRGTPGRGRRAFFVVLSIPTDP